MNGHSTPPFGDLLRATGNRRLKALGLDKSFNLRNRRADPYPGQSDGN